MSDGKVDRRVTRILLNLSLATLENNPDLSVCLSMINVMLMAGPEVLSKFAIEADKIATPMFEAYLQSLEGQKPCDTDTEKQEVTSGNLEPEGQ